MENIKKTQAQRDNTYPLFGNGELAELISHDPMKILEIDIAVATHYYNVEYIGQILNQVELLADVDRLIGLIQTQWELDVCDCRQQVVKYDPAAKDYVPILEDLPEKLTRIRQKIEKRLQLKALRAKQMEEWKVAHTSTATQTQSEPADVKNQTEAPQFAEENQTPQEDEVVYHLADLTDEEVRNNILLKTDQQYTCLVQDMRGPVKRWIDKHRFQDLNVVKFTLAKHYIIARNTSVRIYAKMIKHLIPSYGDQEENIKKRKDANQKNWETYENNKDFWKLKNDVKTVEECLANTIHSVKSVA